MKFAAFGRTNWMYDSIRACCERGHELVLVGTCEESPESTVRADDFRRWAERCHAAFFSDSRINQPDRIQMARDSGAEIAISVNWMTMIHEEMISQFLRGVVNAHAGDLPRFRGNAAPNWAILLRENQVILTLHRMTPALDAGEILSQRAFPLTEDTYVRDVYRFLDQNIPMMFADLLDQYERGDVESRPQADDPAKSLRCFPRRPEDGFIDWNRSADDIARLIRAAAEPFAGAYTYLDGSRLTVWRGRADRLPYPHVGIPGQIVERRPDTKEVSVLTGDGILRVQEVQLAGQMREPASVVLKSTRQRLGMVVESEIDRLRERVRQLESVVSEFTAVGN